MKRLALLLACAVVAMSACNDSPSSPSGSFRPARGPALVVTGFSAIDAGAGPADARPNADAAAAAFDAAASALRPLKFENLENAATGDFTSLPLLSMTITKSENTFDQGGGILQGTGTAILGYNTTGDGSKYLQLVPPFGVGTVAVTFTPTVKLQAWGAYFTGVGTVPNTSVDVVFDDGSAQTFAVPGSESGGATFFGFTDPDRIITSVTVRETLTSDGNRDILSIDDIRYAPASGNTQVVPANEAATVTVTEEGQAVAGIDIPTGTFAQAVTVTVRFVSPVASAPCHDYLLGQKGRCLEISARNALGAKVVNQQPITAALCLPDDVAAEELFKFESATDTPVALKQVGAPFLNCVGFQVGSAVRARGIEGLARGFARSVSGWLTPKPLYAAHAGFGGLIKAGGGLSFFTWASPIQIGSAGLGVNVLGSAKDVFALSGAFNLQPKSFQPNLGESGFDPARDAVTVAFGKSKYTIASSSFKYSSILKRWVYGAQTAVGVTAMVINPINGSFTLAATVPTDGALPSSRSFSVQMGHRTQGVLLECDVRGVCLAQEH